MITLGSIILGGLAGFLASQLMKGHGSGILVNILVGILGGFLGGWLFSLLGITTTGGIVGELVVSTVGAVVLLWLVSKLK